MIEDSPIIVGGKGGSGTRVIVDILRLGGSYWGDVNESNDSMHMLDFTRKWFQGSLESWCSGAPLDMDQMKAEFKPAYDSYRVQARDDVFGWKNPQSSWLLPFWAEVIPNFRFIHVIRDGRDMAFAANQNEILQAKGSSIYKGIPETSWMGGIHPYLEDRKMFIRFWAALNTLIADYCEVSLGDNYLRVRLEDVREDFQGSARKILNFASLDDSKMQDHWKNVMDMDRSGPRWKRFDVPQDYMDELSDEARPVLERFGYPPDIEVG